MTTSLRWLTLALFAGSALGLTNCKKNSELEPDKRSQREIWLTTPGWNMQSITNVATTPAGVVTTDTSPPDAYFSACALDDLRRFNANRTFTVDDGPVRCQPSAPPSTETWDFASNETEIIFSSAAKGTKITTLTATSLALALAYSETFPDGTTWVQTLMFTAR